MCKRCNTPLFFLFVRRCQLILNRLQNPWTHLSLNLFVVSNSGKSFRTICFIVDFIHLPVIRWFFARRSANRLLSLTSCSWYFPFCWYPIRIRFLCDTEKFLYLGYSSIHLYIVRGQIRSSKHQRFTVSVCSCRFRHLSTVLIQLWMEVCLKVSGHFFFFTSSSFFFTSSNSSSSCTSSFCSCTSRNKKKMKI